MSQLSICRKLFYNSEWHGIRTITDDDASILQQPRLLMLRLAAAEKIGDPDLYKDIGRVADLIPAESKIKLPLLRDMARKGYASIAARALLNDPDLVMHPIFFKTLSTITRGVDDPALKQELRAAALLASGGGLAIRSQLSPFSFAARPAAPYVFGSVHLDAAPNVPSHHLPGLQEQVVLFLAEIDKAHDRNGPILIEFHDVFTDRNGQIWREGGQIIRSLAKPIASVTRADVPNVKIAMLSQRPTKGIYHWLVDRIPGFAWLNETKNAAVTMPVLIADNAPGYEIESLRMMKIADQVHLVGDAVFVERLVEPAVGFRNMVGWKQVNWGIRQLVDSAMTEARSQGVILPPRIYISRRDAKRRSLTNEAEIEAAIAMRGFVTYQFSEIPLWHQIALVHSAEVVLGPHGAGLAHLIFAQPGMRVIEIVPIKDGTYRLRFNYARLSIIKGLDYHGWIEEQQLGINSWALDIDRFLAFLDQTLAKPTI